VNDTLLAEVERRLYGSDVAPAVADLVLTACLAPGELGGDQEDRARRSPASPETVTPPPMPARTYLANLKVEGFRGIGSAVELSVAPGPGLTLVVGRNGTGKSSIADALEVLLTGISARHNLGRRNKAWLDGWRNLHHPRSVLIEADLVVEGRPGFTTVRRRWAEAAEFDTGTTTVSRPGEANVGFDSLGWEEALSAYRPFLPYSELGGLLDDGPSKLFDTLNAILGLDELTQAAKALSERRLALAGRAKRNELALERLRMRLESSDDGRAASILAATAKRTPDLGAVERVLGAGETETGDGNLDLLRRLAGVEPPARDELEAAAARLEEAAAGLVAIEGSDSAEALRTADLLRAALEFYEHRGDGDCPVCGSTAAITAHWRREASAEERRLREIAYRAEAARLGLSRATEAARSLVRPPPSVLSAAAEMGLDTGGGYVAWTAWAGGPSEAGAQALADHLRTAAEFSDGIELLADEARRSAALREISWKPVAVEVAAWLADAMADRRDARLVKDLKASEEWLKRVEEEIRTERFEPLAKAAGEVWRALRMRSSVDIGGIRLAGSATRRRVEVQVSVDGVRGTALGVMSQGELHALALSLFVPRATLEESPFRFVVVDDPVQAMDPAKVEGLARVLESAARTHQVIVLTHDDRLDEAVRRLGIDATVFEVTRGSGSVVNVTRSLDPVRRRVADARTVARADELPPAVRARVVPTVCRQAIEAQCMATVRRRRLGRGDPHDEVEQVLAAARKLYPLAALALFDDEAKTNDVLGRLDGWGSRMATAFKRCNRGAHEGDEGDLPQLVDDVSELTRQIGRLK
jgi:ABC-type Mn2+/Zn2+ transport system ATPase subunit